MCLSESVGPVEIFLSRALRFKTHKNFSKRKGFWGYQSYQDYEGNKHFSFKTKEENNSQSNLIILFIHKL